MAGFFGRAKKKDDWNPIDMMKVPSDDHLDTPLTIACLPDDDSSNVFSMFAETFFQDKNQDCLEQVLSFLTCNELATSAKTCKALQHLVFQASDKEGHINMIWHGAEKQLVRPHDRTAYFTIDRRFGANAREHCRLFIVASTFAKACEASAKRGEIEEDRMMVDGVLTSLMNVRGFDAESIAEKKAMAEAVTRTDDSDNDDDKDEHYDYDDSHDDDEEEKEEHADYGDDSEDDDEEEEEDEDSEDDYDDSDGDDEVAEEEEESGIDPENHSGMNLEIYDWLLDFHNFHNEADPQFVEVLKKRFSRHEMFQYLTPPEKIYYHKVFVRVTRESNGEVICQGFCEQKQKLAWKFGLDLPPSYVPQGLKIPLDFESLMDADEIESFLESLSALGEDADEVPSLGLQVTAVVISEKDLSCQCLFQQDQSQDLELDSTSVISRNGDPCKKSSFALQPTWGRADTIQLGPSSYSHQYFLDFSFLLITRDIAGGTWVVPILEVDVQKDPSNVRNLIIRQFGDLVQAGEISEEAMAAAVESIQVILM